eukprot:INCI2546.1.p1 GENE.INCI2546.1~~INCI2546.1.p1  ORF type:complete len:412 (-),score=72.08 INCI2546.1:159-1394(-)
MPCTATDTADSASEAEAAKQLRVKFAAGIEACRKRKQVRVSFANCACGDGGVKGFNEGVLEIAEALEGNSTIEVLDLANVGMTIKSSAPLGVALATCLSLRRLDLSGNPGINDGCMRQTERSSSKNTSTAASKDPGAKSASTNTNDESGTALNVLCLGAAFAHTAKLSELNLNGASLSDAGVYNLCRHLRKGPSPGQTKVRLLNSAFPLSPAVRALLRRGYAGDAFLHYHTRAGSMDWVREFSSTPSASSQVVSMQTLYVAKRRPPESPDNRTDDNSKAVGKAGRLASAPLADSPNQQLSRGRKLESTDSDDDEKLPQGLNRLTVPNGHLQTPRAIEIAQKGGKPAHSNDGQSELQESGATKADVHEKTTAGDLEKQVGADDEGSTKHSVGESMPSADLEQRDGASRVAYI